MYRRTLNTLIVEAKELRSEAIADAKRICPVTRSCGVDLDLIDDSGELIERVYGMALTQAGLVYEIERAIKSPYLNPARFALSGTIDGADSVWGLNNMDYEPALESWAGAEFTASDLGITIAA